MHPRTPRGPTRAGLIGLALAALVLAEVGVGAGAEPSPHAAVDVGLDLADRVALRGASSERTPALGWIPHPAVHAVAPERSESSRRGGENDPQAHASPLMRWRLAHSTSSGVD